MSGRRAFLSAAAASLADIAERGHVRTELVLNSPQSGRITVSDRDAARMLVNLCSNNYLGLADHPALTAAAAAALDEFGFGLASARFICGTHSLHLRLEARLAAYLGKEDAILFVSAFDANAGLFEALLGPEDVVVSDALNHASIIDGIRLSRARRLRYATSDMSDLGRKLAAAQASGARHIMVATDGVFSMDGWLARLPEITRLAKKHGAVVMVDDCHATGILGPQGRGTAHLFGVEDEVDLLTGTLGKALGGAIGGFVAGPRPVIALLRQRARPYLFSNSLPPAVAAGALAAIDLAEAADDLRAQLVGNAAYWRAGLAALGFQLLPGDHPIVPVMLGDAAVAKRFAEDLRVQGIHVVSLSFPVVPEGEARIRTQLSAAHERGDLDLALAAFAAVGRKLGAIG